MRILLTNDDGVHAPGLTVLEEIARTLSDDIWIVAPSEEQSGAGHSLTLTRPLRIRQHGETQFSVTGTPTDAVMMAVGAYYMEGIFIVNHLQRGLVPRPGAHWAEQQVQGSANWCSGSRWSNWLPRPRSKRC